MAFDYCEAPKQEVFEDIKANAIKLWQTYDNTYGYVDEKVDRIKDIKNIKDNTGYIVAMFDYTNQMKLFNMVGEESQEYIQNCWKFVGN